MVKKIQEVWFDDLKRERDALKSENEKLKKDLEEAVSVLRQTHEWASCECAWNPGECGIDKFLSRFPAMP